MLRNLGCIKLSVVISKIENPYSIYRNVFSGIFSNAALIVPVGTKDTYQSTAGWSNFKIILEDGEGGRIGQDITVDGIRYKIGEDNTVSVIGKIKYKWPGIPYNIYSGDIVIPNLIYFAGIAYSVTSIGYYAFSHSNGLTSVTIPNSVKSIGSFAFNDCSSLTTITIPYSVTSIELSAFWGCSGLVSIIVEDGNMYYDSRNNCNAIIKTKTNDLVVGCQNTIIPATVSSIGSCAFQSCSSLTNVIIPPSVTSISSTAFQGCGGLISIKVEDGNTYYDSRNNCNAIIETSSNTLIRGCDNTIIPNSVTSIGDEAFSGCSRLTSIAIPNDLTSIGSLAFRDCSGLTSITIPNKVTSIANYTFDGCSGLTSINIPNGITSIVYSAFMNCSGLISIALPNSVQSIDDQAFLGCSGLTSITIPDEVPSIGRSTFANCSSLLSITIPNSVKSIGNNVLSGCNSLKVVNSEIDNPFSISNYAFNDIPSDTKLIVPKGTKSKYQAADGWNRFTNIVEVVDGDANGDERVNQADVENVESFIMGMTPSVLVRSAADMNGDQKIDVVDIVLMQNVIKK